jgi:ferredoxin
MTLKISLDQPACIGTGLCVMEADDVFDQRDEDGVVIVIDPDPAEGREKAVRAAAAACPVNAIVVELV